MKMIVGLGNPGKQYEKTRHNVGFMAIDRLSEKYGISVSKKECQALTGKGMIDGQQVLLVKPQTFMNNSGQAVGELIHYYDTIDDFIIIHDDMDIPLGKIRFKQKGSAGGHNGLKSIIAHLNSQEFDRLKIGIGHNDHNNVIGHVLSGFNKDEAPVFQEVLAHVDEWCTYWLANGITASMNQFN
ncbi:MAG: aminoacyl-tRNA hydrolase [Peptococcaceae bacterium]|nr:aminoacyl-tRNA hydrolase [Peptococcaceae bacterium]